MRVSIVGTGSISGRAPFAPSMQLAKSHPATAAAEIRDIPEGADPDPRALRMMSRGARLAAIAARRAVDSAGWSRPCEDAGFFLGVGATTGSMDELFAIVRASDENGHFSLQRFGDKGMKAANPLFSFQLMNNFSLCHAAISEGTQGPNLALYSRGSGTVAALAEAIAAIESGECARALAGGADSALHAMTWDEIARSGRGGDGLVPGEGAAILALAPEAKTPLSVERAWFAGSRGKDPLGRLLARVEPGSFDLLVIAPCDVPSRERLAAVRERAPRAEVHDASLLFGEAIAASPSLAWLEALDRLRERRAPARALVVSSGIDGDLGAAVFCTTGAP